MGEINVEKEPPGEEQKAELKIPHPPFTLEILKLIKDAQQQHGLRHGDYQRYRGYCSRRIRRLRKTLKIPQGDKRHFKRKDVTEALLAHPKADDRLLQISLNQAERCWSYAMQLRQEANTEPRKKFHLVQRLRKACGHAMQLEELCQTEYCDARTKLEAQAYVAWMHGTLHFELQQWVSAAENLKKSQVIYEGLMSALPDDEQMPYRQRLEELIPSLRYCAYNIGDDKAINLLELRGQGLLENLDKLVAQTRSEQSEQVHEVRWFNTKVTVRSEKIRTFLISLEEMRTTIDSLDTPEAIEKLDAVLVDCRDAVTQAREDARQGGPGPQLVLAYMLYVRLNTTVERNLRLITQAKKVQDIVRLYEIILQQMNELQQLTGMEENREYQAEILAQTTMYRGFRCVYMARALANTRRWSEAAAIYVKARQYLSQSESNRSFVKSPGVKEKLDKLRHLIDEDELNARAQTVLETESESPALAAVPKTRSKIPLIERLDEYVEDPQVLTKNPNLVTLPPPLTPVPCKPFFFDLAFNMLEFPDLQDHVEGSNKPKAGQSGPGVSGFVKGLLGWGGAKK